MNLIQRTRARFQVAPFYGWYVVGALFFSMFLGVGARNGFGIFVETWEREFHASVATISIAAAVGWLVNGVSQVVFGRMVDRFGGRIVVTIGLIVMGLGTASIAAVGNVYALIALYGVVVSFASGALSGGPPSVVAARWFRKSRGRALSTLASGGSVGGLVFVPFLTYLLIWTDWRTSWLIAGVIVLFLGAPVVYFVVRDDPRDVGESPDGVRDRTGVGGAPGRTPDTPLEAKNWTAPFRTAPMWQLSLGYFVCGVTTGSISVHYVRWAVSEGITPTTAALAFGLLSGINAIGVILIGSLSDRVERRLLLGCVYLVRGSAFLILLILPGQWALWGFALAGGASWLATVPLTTGLAADFYGLRHMGSLVGLINFAHQIGGALAVYLFGLVFDISGNYDPAIAAGVIFLVMAGIISLTIRERRYSVRYASASPLPAPAGPASST